MPFQLIFVFISRSFFNTTNIQYVSEWMEESISAAGI